MPLKQEAIMLMIGYNVSAQLRDRLNMLIVDALNLE